MWEAQQDVFPWFGQWHLYSTAAPVLLLEINISIQQNACFTENGNFGPLDGLADIGRTWKYEISML